MPAATILPLRAAIVSALILAAFLGVWQMAVSGVGGGAAAGIDPDLAALLGPQAKGQSAFPTPAGVGKAIWEHLSDPFYDAGPNDKGIGIQLAYSILRVAAGFGLALAVAVPLGFLIGMSPLVSRALDPFFQILKPISPLAWMPLALYTIKDSTLSSIFVIFICSLWPMLINTAFGVATVRRDYCRSPGRWSWGTCAPPSR
jgi:nitrate/nitrite transport system permease protein